VRWEELGGRAVLPEHLPVVAFEDVADVAALDRLARSSVGAAAVDTLEVLCAAGSVPRWRCAGCGTAPGGRSRRRTRLSMSAFRRAERRS
jgi:hypothetical protein